MTDERLVEIEEWLLKGHALSCDTGLDLAAEVRRLRAELDALQRFKEWVHAYLDAKGVPAAPEGPHGKEGCRIGDRMDWVFAEPDKGAAEMRERIAGILESCAESATRGDIAARWRAMAARVLALPLTPPVPNLSPASELSS